jgi:tetratricopeptide (TPR) repeat protein
MLYSILPPIIVIASFIGVIMFLLRKASRVADLREVENREVFENSLENAGFFKRIFSRIGSFFRLRFKIWFWAFLEKMTRKFRMLFLKLESSFSNISSRIREKKNSKKIEAEAEKNPMAGGEEKTEVQSEEYDFSYLRKKSHEKLAKNEKKELKIKIDEDEKPIKPMISDKVVSPRSRSEMKDILEDVLIERIAANPKDIEAYERLGEYYMEIGNYEHAKECIKQVIKLDPINRSAKYKMKRLERLIAG